jgi:hypothetical protein
MDGNANAAILYRPEAFSTVGERLMGRQAAGEGFLTGFRSHSQVASSSVTHLFANTPSTSLQQ